MDLELVVDSLDAIPEEHRPLYVQGDDGKYRLPVKGLDSISRLEKTVAALRTERDGAAKENRELKQQLEGLKAQVESLGDIEKVKEIIAERETIQEEEAKKKGTVEDHYKSQIELLKKEQLKALEAKDRMIEERDKIIMARTRKADMAEAVAAANPVDWLRQHTELWLERQAEVRRDEDGEYRTYARFGDGELHPLKTYAELWAKTEEGQRFTRGPDIAGGGAENVNGAKTFTNPFHPDTFNLTEQGRLKKENPALYERYRKAADAKRGIPLHTNR